MDTNPIQGQLSVEADLWLYLRSHIVTKIYFRDARIATASRAVYSDHRQQQCSATVFCKAGAALSILFNVCLYGNFSVLSLQHLTPPRNRQMKASMRSQQPVSRGDPAPDCLCCPSSQTYSIMRNCSAYNEQPFPPRTQSISTALVSLASCRQEENSQRGSVTVWRWQHSSSPGSAWGPAALCESPVWD